MQVLMSLSQPGAGEISGGPASADPQAQMAITDSAKQSRFTYPR
jgi:hypothetical protein